MGEKTERARSPWVWDLTQIRGVVIPPSTPSHPTEPVREEMVPAGAEGPESREHLHYITQYVNGWCVCVWILWHPAAGAPALTEDPYSLQSADALQTPSQAQANWIAAELRKANDLLRTEQCDVAFRVCDIIVLDTSRVTWGPPHNPRRLSDLFTAAGQLTLLAGSNQSAFADALGEIMTNGQPQAFINKMRTKCINLFIAHSVEDASTSAPEHGVGAHLSFGNTQLSWAVIEVGAPRPAQTIVHEFIHALGQDDHSTEPGSVFGDEIGEDDTHVEPQLCGAILQWLEQHLEPACP